MFSRKLLVTSLVGLSFLATTVQASEIARLFSNPPKKLTTHKDGKTVSGFKVDVCSFENSLMDYCNPKTIQSILAAAKQSKQPKVFGKYDIITATSINNRKISSIVAVDLKGKKIYASNIEFDTGSKVSFDAKTGNIRITSSNISYGGYIYHGGGRAYDEYDGFVFDPNNKDGFGPFHAEYGMYSD